MPFCPEASCSVSLLIQNLTGRTEVGFDFSAQDNTHLTDGKMESGGAGEMAQ